MPERKWPLSVPVWTFEISQAKTPCEIGSKSFWTVPGGPTGVSRRGFVVKHRNASFGWPRRSLYRTQHAMKMPVTLQKNHEDASATLGKILGHGINLNTHHQRNQHIIKTNSTHARSLPAAKLVYHITNILVSYHQQPQTRVCVYQAAPMQLLRNPTYGTDHPLNQQTDSYYCEGTPSQGCTS